MDTPLISQYVHIGWKVVYVAFVQIARALSRVTVLLLCLCVQRYKIYKNANYSYAYFCPREGGTPVSGR